MPFFGNMIGAYAKRTLIVTRVVTYASNNDGYVALSGRTAVVELWGNTSNNTSTAVKLADIGSATDSNSLSFNKTGLYISTSENPYIWVKIYASGNILSSKYCAEAIFYDGNGNQISTSSYAKIGTMTAGGGLAAAFDGVTNQSAAASAQLAASTDPGWVGLAFV